MIHSWKATLVAGTVLIFSGITLSSCAAWPSLGLVAAAASGGDSGGGGLNPLLLMGLTGGDTSTDTSTTTTETSTDTGTSTSTSSSGSLKGVTYSTTTTTASVGSSSSVSAPAVDAESGASYSFSASGLPAGMSIDSSTGAISGTPTAACTTTDPCAVTVTVTAGDGSTVTTTIYIDVNDVAPTTIEYTGDGDNDGVIDATLQPGSSGQTTGSASTDGSGQKSDGSGTLVYSVSSLRGTLGGTPGSDLTGVGVTSLSDIGLSLDANTGEISGTPTYSGTFQITMKADNSAGDGGSTTRTFTFTVANPTMAIAGASAGEGAGTISFVATLSNKSLNASSIEWKTAGGTAASGSDFTAVDTTGADNGSKEVTIAAGSLTGNLTVSVTDDATNETDETFTATILSASNTSSITTATGTGTITDNDTPRVDFAAATSSGSESSSATITVNVSPAPASAVTVNYSFSGGSATGGGTDYTDTTTSFTISGGSSTGTITIPVNNDGIDEANETIQVTLQSGTGYNVGSTQTTHTYTINDDDVPTIDFNATTSSGAESSSPAGLAFSVSPAPYQDITVNYSFSGGTATGGSDYTNTTTTVTVSAGSTTGSISVPVTDDSIYESSETVAVSLAAGTGYAVGTTRPTHTYTITDNDTAPTLSIGDASLTEGDSGQANLTFTVSRTGSSQASATFDYTVGGGTATGDSSCAATDGTDDYVSTGGSGSVSGGGATGSTTINIPVCGDDVFEGNQTFVVTLSNPGGATISDATATGTIIDNDTAPALSIGDASLTEGDSGSANLGFTVTRTGKTEVSATFDYTVGGGTATGDSACSATDGSDDYENTGGSGSVSAGGATGTTTVNIPVCGDTMYEGNQTFVVTLSSPGSATISDATGTGTITDNDTAPTLSIGDASITEGDSGSTNLSFTVTRTGLTESAATFDYSYGGGTATGDSACSATDGTDDYISTGGTGASIAAGGATGTTTLTVPVCGDIKVESSETFVATISGASGASISDATGTGTITDNDTAPSVSIGSPSASQVNGSGSITYTVTYTGTTSVALDNADISLNTTGGASCSVAVTGGTTATPSVTLSSCTGNGTVGIGVAAGQGSDGVNVDTGAGPSTTFTVDTVVPTVSIGAPSGSYAKNGTDLTYTVTYSGTDTVALDNADISLNTTGGASCSVAVTGGTTATPTVTLSSCTGNGTVGIGVAAGQGSDLAGNTDAGAGPSTTFIVDNTVPVVSSVSPSGGSSVNSTLVSFTFSEICASGSVTWTRISGSADVGSPHVQALTGSELNAGAHTNVTLSNNPTLVDAAVYDISFDCTDRAGNAASTVTSSSVTFTDSPLAIVGAETVDRDGNGKIDAYRIAFNKSVNDSTFPGYSANSAGSVTTDWLVAGYINVRLLHGTAVSWTTDTANDSVIYLGFDEGILSCNAASQAGCDTGAKPDLSSTATPGLQDQATNTISQVGSASVTEVDGAKPILVTAKSLGATSLDVIFSEAVDQTEAEKTTNYSLTGGLSVSAASRDGSDFKTVHLTAGTQVGGDSYTLTVNTDVKDLANYNLSSSANTATFTGLVKPVVVSITPVNTTTLTITFNESIVASSAECSSTTTCATIYSNTALPVKSAVSTAGAGVNSASFTLTVNDMVEGQSYTTTVLENTATSVASSEKIGNTNNSATFTGDGRPGVVVHTDTATACGNNGAKRVVVEYDQSVGATALTGSNYRVTQCLVGSCSIGTGSPNADGAATVTSAGGNKYNVDFTDAFNTSGDQYQLSVYNVQDSTGNAVATPTNLGFQCGSDTTAPVLVAADVVSSDNSATVVLLTFSEAVDQTTANTATNYKYDSQAYGTGVYAAAKQTNPSQVLVTFQPQLADGGHQISVQNVQDLVSNAILTNGTNNVQPIIVNASTGFSGGDVFEDPFGDGTTAGQIVIYDGKLYLGADSTSSKLFEVDYGLTSSQTITLDADGTPGAPVYPFYDYASSYSGTIKGVDTLYAACVGGSSTPKLTGSACTAVNGTEKIFIGALNVAGNYVSYWESSDKTSSTTTFTFKEGNNPDPGGSAAYRSTVFVVYKDQLWNQFGAELGGGGRGGRICVSKDYNGSGTYVGPGAGTGCADGTTYGSGVALSATSKISRIGASGNPLKNGSVKNALGNSQYLNAINILYEYDADGASGNNDCSGGTDCESQLYMANGGVYKSTALGSSRSTSSDGGIVRSSFKYSKRNSLPGDCGSNCMASSDTDTSSGKYWVDVTPDSNSKWNNSVSIPYPENSAVTGEKNCSLAGSQSSIEMDCSKPYNIFTPAMKAIPYMRTAPNCDLYAIRNSCSSQIVCNNGADDGGTCDFEDTLQVCPPGSEVPQLWMLPGCSSSVSCPATASEWKLVAEYGSSGKTNMQGNNATVGSHNTHITLLEFVGDYIYVGYDNSTDGANIWRSDMGSVTSGNTPLESSFSIVNITGLDGTATNQRLFSHVTVHEGGTDWLIVATRDGTNSMKLYRTANNQN